LSNSSPEHADLKPDSMKFPVVILILLALLAWWFDWIPFARRTAGLEKSAPVAEVQRADIAPSLPLSGQVTPAFQVDVKPEIGGKLAKIHVVAGDRVKKDQPLATIDDTDLLNERAGVDAEIEGARLSVERIRGNHTRAKQLFDGKLLSREEFANIDADLRIAENELERSMRRRQLVDDRISKTRILSPADGTILQIPVSEGQVVVAAASVNSGTSLMTFADLSRLLITTHVNQLDAGKLSLGQRLSVMPPDGSGDAVDAVITFIAPLATVKNNIKGFEVVGELEGARHGLKPGVSVSMGVPLGRAENALSVPITAVFDEDGEKVVYLNAESAPERRVVEIGLSDSARAEIRSGLEEGEEVLLARPENPSTKKSGRP
jgi:RND family efflux transporter MFP subunit